MINGSRKGELKQNGYSYIYHLVAENGSVCTVAFLSNYNIASSLKI